MSFSNIEKIDDWSVSQSVRNADTNNTMIYTHVDNNNP